MTINVRLVGGSGTEVAVEPNKALRVAQAGEHLPPEGVASTFRFFSQLVSSNGDGTGTTNLNVDGSVTAQLFTVDAIATADIKIMRMMIVIEDGTVSHSTFGALAALTNGIDIFIVEAGVNTFLIQNAKKFADLIEQTFAEAPFGDGLTAFELISTTGNEDSQILPMDLGGLVPKGIRIGRDTSDVLCVRIEDDLTALTSFTVRVAGYRHFPPHGPFAG